MLKSLIFLLDEYLGNEIEKLKNKLWQNDYWRKITQFIREIVFKKINKETNLFNF